MTSDEQRAVPPGPRPPRRLHIFAIAALAVAQPLLDLLRRSPEFFVAHGLDRLDIIVLTALLLAGVPAGLLLLARIAGRVRAEALVSTERIILAGLFGVLPLMALKQTTSGTGYAALAMAGIIGALAMWAYERIETARSFVTWLGVGLVAIPLLFLARPPVSRLLAPLAPSERVTAKPRHSPPIVFVVFDQLPLVSLLGPDERIDATRYPAFAALADDAIWFRQATTVGTYTGWALPALLTGRYPDGPRLPNAADHPHTLFTLLGGAYDLDVHEPITALCPADLCRQAAPARVARLGAALADAAMLYLHLALPEAVTARLPSVTDRWKGFGGDDTLQAHWLSRRDADRRADPLAFIASLAPRDRPTLHFLHVLLPHEPYVYLPAGQVVTSRFLPGLSKGRWTDRALTVAQNYQQHLMQVGYVDRLLGLLVARLQEQGLYDEVLLVVASDHGASFRPASLFKSLGDNNAVDLMSVPLLIKLPGRANGSVDDRAVETIDVLPTIADLLDLPMPWPIDGRSALDRAAPPRRRKRVYVSESRYRTFDHPLDLAEPVRRKVELFGRGEDVYAPPSLAPFRDLVGSAPSEHAILEPGATRSTLTAPRVYLDVDPASHVVPARITGRVSSVGPEAADALAVSVNGVIRATTRVVDQSYQGAHGRWSVLVDPAAFHPGDNEVAVYAVSSRGEAVALTPLYARNHDAEAMHLALEAAELAYGIQLTGFHEHEWLGDRLVRCTNGRGRLLVPAFWRASPANIVVSIARAGVGFTRVELRVNECRLLDERIPPGRWSRTIPLEGCGPLSDPTVIEIDSDSFVTRDGRRTIGVCLDALHFVGPS